jgi:segregation and condensation protein B
MEDISRELPSDTTSGKPVGERGKGPEELIAFERLQLSAELVVRDRLADAKLEVPVTPNQDPAAPNDAAVPAEPVAERAMPTEASESAAAMEVVDAAAVAEPVSVPESSEAGETSAPEVASEARVDREVLAIEAIATPSEGEAETGGESQNAGDAGVDALEASAAVAAEAEVAEIEEDLGGDEEGLPPVPELADPAAVARMVYVLMLTAREGLTLFRLAQACNTTQKLVEQALALLQEQMQQLDLPVELARTGDTVKWMSRSDAFPYLQRLRGVKKLEKLSPAALETLAVIAYRQPVMRSEIEAIRGVKAGPMLRTLLQHKLVRCTGRADVPGRPLQYGTTQQFLERFGLAALTDLPSVKELKSLG